MQAHLQKGSVAQRHGPAHSNRFARSPASSHQNKSRSQPSHVVHVWPASLLGTVRPMPGAVKERPVDLSKFYFFDPQNPENLVEVAAKPAPPARSQSPPPPAQTHINSSNGLVHNNGGQGTQLAKSDNKQLVMQLQQANAQLETARKTIAQLQQYEILFKETRMQTKQMTEEIGLLQAMVAEKDAELARQYDRMKRDALERNGLRSQYTVTLDEVKALRQDLEEARHAMLDLQGSMLNNRLTDGAGSYASNNIQVFNHESSSNGNGAANAPSGASGVLQSLHGFARQLADTMEGDLNSFSGHSK